MIPEDAPRVCSFDMLLRRRYLIPTATIVFRRTCLGVWPSWARLLPWADSILILILSDRGPFLFERTQLAVYNCGHGISRDFTRRSILDGEILMARFLLQGKVSNRKNLSRKLSELYEELARYLENEDEIILARHAIYGALVHGDFFNSLFVLRVKWFARLKWPSLHDALYGLRRWLSAKRER